MAKLLTEISHFGRFKNVSGILFNESDRTVEQYKRIRVHPIVHLGLSFIKIGLPDVPFIVEGPDEDIKRTIEAVYKKIWARMIKDSLESLDFGFKTMENLYKVGTIKYKDEDDNEQEFSGHLLKQPKSLDPETIDLIVDDLGNFTGFKQDGNIDITVKDKKALVIVNRWESGNYYGISDLEYVYTPWYDANINRQFSMRWLERKGTGIFKGTYPSGKDVETGKDNSDIMLELLDSIMEGTAVALPSDTDNEGNVKWDITILDSDDKTDSFIEKAKYLDDTMLRGLVIPEKALTQGEVGARSSIESFQAFFIQRKQDLLDNQIFWINEYSLKPFIEINWGGDIVDEYMIKAGKIDDNSVIVANQLIQKLIEKGSIKPERQWLIDKTGIPLEEEEEIIEEEIPEEDEDIIDELPDEEEEPDKIEMQEKSMNARETKFKMAELGSFLSGRSDQFQMELEENILSQLERVKRFVTKNYTTDKFMPVVNGINLNQGPVNSIMKNYLKDIYNDSFDKFQAGVEGSADFKELELSDIDNINISDGRVNFAEPSSFIGFRTALSGGKFLSDLLAEMKFAVSNSLGTGASLTETLAFLTRKVKEFITARKSNISETELAFTLDKANTDYLKINAQRVAKGLIPPGRKIERFVSSAVLDDRTTELCRELDGLVVEAGSPVMEKFATPRHFHCRSVWIPITQDEIDDPRMADTDLTTGKNGKPVTTNQVTAQLGTVSAGKNKTALDELTFQ